jgi:hypothetical protein
MYGQELGLQCRPDQVAGDVAQGNLEFRCLLERQRLGRRLEKRRLVPVPGIEGSLGDPGPGRNRIHGGAAVAVLQEEIGGGSKESVV